MALAPKKANDFINEENPTDDFEFVGWEPTPTIPPEGTAVGGAVRNVTIGQIRDIISGGFKFVRSDVAPANPDFYTLWLDTSDMSDIYLFGSGVAIGFGNNSIVSQGD